MLARVDDNQVQEFRQIDMSAVPPHKRHLWRPVVEEGEGEDKQVTVAADHVKITRSPRPQRVRPAPEPDPHEGRIAVLEAKVAALLEAIQTAGAR